jgi:hypothetical protein
MQMNRGLFRMPVVGSAPSALHQLAAGRSFAERVPSMRRFTAPIGKCIHGARAQSAVLTAVVAAGTLLLSCGLVAAQSTEEKQAQCELSAIRDTRSALAVQTIRSACNWLALNGESLLNERSRGYYICLVQQLSGAQADEAAAAIMSACRRSNPL